MEQLRFNISEKIRLHPQQAGISSLLELDLYPDVEIKDEGHHLKIFGYLRLNGTYEGDSIAEADVLEYDPDELEGEEIAYVIPVEITLPRDRAELANICAEVESFDYQLLSPFELQIEAVLMIDGILPDQEEELITEISDDSQEQEEIEGTPTFAANPAQSEFLEVPDPQRIEAKEEEVSVEEKVSVEEEVLVEEPVLDRTIHRETRRTAKERFEEKSEEAPQPLLVIEEGKQEEVEQPSSTEEEVRGKDWSRWLVNGKEDTFTSLKMVIVQKDESIDTLAAKYEISCDAILKTNEFATDRLVEGQIVKIPVKRN
ncbi:LysM peptidoglycan-binding domain-containing protein [Shimazuella kribbensis]|uniref:LysM peptidoglycan-binding domain-containing protein n=1 Tax=Shimazuella kribbensis TaxID=139808 RepID=UPI0003FBABEF|nr:LysM peptidoglycan-binding domain-containing protein [Shimazuella kribbensis]